MSTMSILSPSSSSPLTFFPRKPQIVFPTAIFRAVNSSSLTSTPQKAPKTSTSKRVPKRPKTLTPPPPSPPPKTPLSTPPQPTNSSTDETAVTTADDSIAYKKKVLVPIGFGTEEMEAVIIVDVFRRAGADVVVASVEAKLEVEASTGTRLVADRLITSCSDEVFDLVALPGGMPGSARLRDCEVLRKITTKQADEKRFYGAICAAPAVTLNSWGLLRRKQTTCHPAFMAKLPHFWAVSSNIQVSGELTTSRGPGTAFQFALSLVEQLFEEAVAKEVGQSLLMHIAADTPIKEEFNKVEWSVDHIPRVLIPVTNGSEEIEVVTIIDILRRAKVDVTVASLEKSMQIVAAQGTKIIADKSIGNAAESLYDLIILPGGLIGAERLQKSRILKKLLKEQESAGRMYGSISSSSTTLQKHGLLNNKRIASHPSILSTLPSEPVDICARVVIDGKLITSTGLSTVTDFALAIVDKFFGHPRARSVAEGLVFEYPRTER